MEALVAQTIREDALDPGSALLYAPAFYPKPQELIALASVADQPGAMYIAHLHNQGSRFLESLDDLIDSTICGRFPKLLHGGRLRSQNLTTGI